MIKVSVFYPQTEGARFDTNYYLTRHIPLVLEKFGFALKSSSIEQGLSGAAPGSAAAFRMMAHFIFESVSDFEAALAPHAEEIMGDIPNYTSIEPLIQISEIKLSS